MYTPKEVIEDKIERYRKKGEEKKWEQI